MSKSVPDEYFIITYECLKCRYQFVLRGTETNIKENKFFNSPRCECGGEFKELKRESDD